MTENSLERSNIMGNLLYEFVTEHFGLREFNVPKNDTFIRWDKHSID